MRRIFLSIALLLCVTGIFAAGKQEAAAAKKEVGIPGELVIANWLGGFRV